MSEQAAERGRRPSIYDVANVAGVSHMTVSRVLNGAPNIRASTRERVEHAIDTLGYRPSAAARELATQRTMRIGAIVHSPTEHGPNSTLLALEQAARGNGFTVVPFSVTNFDVTESSDAVAAIGAQGVDALCVIGPHRDTADAIRAAASGTPLIVVSEREAGYEDFPHVGVAQAAGVHQAMDYLISLGHRSIMHLAGPLVTNDSRTREQGWSSAMLSAGLHPEHLVIGDWSADSGYAVGANHPAIDDITAVFAANDQMALGLMHGLWRRGKRVPHDVSVVGFDDIPDARHFLPPLTTVRQDFSALGVAVMGAISRVLDGSVLDEPVLIPAELVVRESCTAAA